MLIIVYHPYLKQEEAILYGIDWDGPLSVEDDEGSVTVPVVPCPIDEQFLENMYGRINPLAHSLNYGVDLFLATVDYVHMYMQ